MARQDIFATLYDDKLGKRCTSSSARGIVKCVRLHINTDVASKGTIYACFDKKRRTVEISGELPKIWRIELKKR